MSKPRVVKDYDKLSEEIIEQIKLAYPYGFDKKLVTFKNVEGKFVSALPFESDDYYYLIRMTKAEAHEIISDDDDYDDDGVLKSEIKVELTERYDMDNEEESDGEDEDTPDFPDEPMDEEDEDEVED